MTRHRRCPLTPTTWRARTRSRRRTSHRRSGPSSASARQSSARRRRAPANTTKTGRRATRAHGAPTQAAPGPPDPRAHAGRTPHMPAMHEQHVHHDGASHHHVPSPARPHRWRPMWDSGSHRNHRPPRRTARHRRHRPQARGSTTRADTPNDDASPPTLSFDPTSPTRPSCAPAEDSRRERAQAHAWTAEEVAREQAASRVLVHGPRGVRARGRGACRFANCVAAAAQTELQLEQQPVDLAAEQ